MFLIRKLFIVRLSFYQNKTEAFFRKDRSLHQD